MSRLTPLLLLLAACGTVDPDDVRDGPVDDDPVDDEGPSSYDPSGDPAQPLSVTVGPGGMTLGHAGVKLEIPEGALSEDVEITVTPTGAPPADYEAASPLWTFGPDGLTFDQPITIELTADRADPDLRMYWSTPVGGWSQVADAEVDGTTVRGTVSHFSTGFTSPPGPETEVFSAPAEQTLDVLMVVDDSCSMIEEQMALAAEFPTFLTAIQATALDWHVGVVSTDTEAANRSGKLVPAGGYRWVDPSTPNPDVVFGQMTTLGTNGAYTERGLKAAWWALTPPDTATELANADFLRPDGQVVFVFVSDEEDQSAPNPTRNEFITWADTLRADPDDVSAHAIVGPVPNGCSGVNGDADSGANYHAVVNAIGGSASSICDADWTPAFEDVLSLIRATECQALLQPADPATVEVFLSPAGTVLPPEAWAYDADDACVYLTPLGNQQAGGSDIGVTYYPPGAAPHTGDTADSATP